MALLTNVLTPYRLPVYADLAATPGWRMRFFVNATTEEHWREAFAGAWQTGRKRLDVEVVRGLTLARRVPFHRDARVRVSTHLPLGLLPALRRFRPDVVIASELGARALLAALYAALFRVPLVIWSYHARANRAGAGPLRRALWRALLARADAVIGMGRQAREVHRANGVPAARLFDAPNAPDQATHARRLAEVDPLAARVALRARLGARAHVALVAGQLVEVKGIEPLLAAWERIPQALRADWTLLFVGDGPLAAAVHAAARRAAPGAIARLPAVAPDRMTELYVASDLLVFPSLGDTWGLVVNEAQLCGLPVAASRLAGCADDLVEPGVTGWRLDPCDTDGLARTLAEALAAPGPERDRIARLARDRAARHTPEAMAAGMRRAVAYALGERRTRV